MKSVALKQTWAWNAQGELFWSVSVHGGHLENLPWISSPELKDQLTWDLVGSTWVICRSKIAKIVPIWNPRWPTRPPSWKYILSFFSWTERPVDRNLRGSIRVACRSKLSTFVPIGNQDGRHCRHLENLFWSFLEPKGQQTRNFIRRIGVTCRSKIAEIIPIGDPRWPLKIYFELLLPNRKANSLETW